MDLDVKYLGTSKKLCGWSSLILAAPAPEKVGSLYMDEGAQNAMNADANWGMILKNGDRGWEDNPKGVAFQPGEWIFFEDFHPQARMIHDQRVYFIPDTRLMSGLPVPHTFEPYVDFYSTLPSIAAKARETEKRVAEKWKAVQEDMARLGHFEYLIKDESDDIR